MKKIVFFDIDGTLLDDDKNLPASTKKAVKTLQQNGVYTALATGRGPFMITSLLEELNIQSHITFNGQYVVFENDLIYSDPLNSPGLEALSIEAEKHQHNLVYMNDTTLKANVRHDDWIEKALAALQMNHPEFDPDFYRKTDIFQVLLFAREEDNDYIKKFERHFNFIRWHKNAMDVVPKGGSKARGIKKLIARLGFDMKDVYAFGDGLNDIEMLKEVGTGIAMGNAHEAVKIHADFVTSHVAEDGIVNGLKKVGLLKDDFETI